MRRLLLLLLLLAALLAAGCERGAEAPAEVFPADPRVVRGIAWGTELASLSGMVPAGGETDVYTRGEEESTIGGVPLSAVEYRFVDGRFDRAVVTFPGATEALRIKGLLFAAYGPVGPFIGQDPGGTASYREYRWQFAAGSIALLLGGEGTQSLLLFSAGEGAPAGL